METFTEDMYTFEEAMIVDGDKGTRVEVMGVVGGSRYQVKSQTSFENSHQ